MERVMTTGYATSKQRDGSLPRGFFRLRRLSIRSEPTPAALGRSEADE